ncbi:hypothetical protein GCM10010401_03600 [Rarobacter faecitabidus]|uniref:Glycosyl transferase family 1 n=1 Tax=Rarobacter faecitabidus TaxID=13243 RepID=A0A542ZU52_RARFA|nr:glycosyltransferase [Rarobacter faecitabidus]TQL63884.1 glycosyl transferase family 1 [Rarobacter faecitabidus]
MIVRRLVLASGRWFRRLMARRSRFPRFVNASIDWVAENPMSPLGRLAVRSYGNYQASDIPAALSAPGDQSEGGAEVLIGPTNYAGQGFLWARAVEAFSRESLAAAISARNLAVEEPAGFSFPADREVPVAVYHRSREWQAAQFAAARTFTHVLYEAERPMFGRLFGRDVAKEIAALDGLSIAMMCHGTDIRLPSRHQDLTPWSPFRDPGLYLDKLERDAARNRELLDSLARPVFVSTPDLLLDVPYATWCPVVVSPERWVTDATAGGRERPIVVHIPSRAAVKGSHLVEPVIDRLAERGEVEFVTARDVRAARMPELYRNADIVLDQFRLGSYGVAACEAMAAGRVVVGHVAEPVRAHVRAATGLDLPIVEATPDTVADAIRSLIADRVEMQAIGRRGVEFVSRVHDGQLSARLLVEGWIGR